MNLEWLNFEGTTFWATARAADGGRLHLLVEVVPGGLWDWTTWRDSDRERSRSGITASAETAILAARTAAEELALHLMN